jgi:hypothetical protein
VNREQALERARVGLPIASTRELVHAIGELQRTRTVERSRVWYELNRYMRALIDAADLEEAGQR